MASFVERDRLLFLMNTLRIGLLMMVCVAIGYLTGSRVHRSAHSDAPSIPDATSAREPAAPKLQRSDEASGASIPDTERATAMAAPSVTERLAMLRWMKSEGLDFGLPVFNNDKISPQFAAVFGLSSAETAQLNEAYREAKQEIDQLTHEHAKLDPASSAAKLIVNVPAFPVEGGKVYNGFLSVFSSVLGEARLSQLNDISGDVLANSLGSFGLEDIRYEITRRPVDHGFQFYDFKRFNSLPIAPGEGAHPFMGTISGRLQAEGLRNIPALKSFPLPSIDSVPAAK